MRYVGTHVSAVLLWINGVKQGDGEEPDARCSIGQHRVAHVANVY